MKKSIQSRSLRATKRIAREFSITILKSPKRNRAFVLALKGELGAGKTSFIQGFAKGLGVKENVLSPTFLIIKKYEIRDSKSEKNTKYIILNTRYFYHIDCYRLKGAKELLQLEWEKIIQNPNNIVAVEWADRVKSIIPKHALWISFSHGNGLTKRKIVIS